MTNTSLKFALGYILDFLVLDWRQCSLVYSSLIRWREALVAKITFYLTDRNAFSNTSRPSYVVATILTCVFTFTGSRAVSVSLECTFFVS